MSAKRAKLGRKLARDAVRALFLGVLTRLRSILKARGQAAYPDTRRPCHTCAFNPGTDSWQGFDSTALGLIRALLNDSPFYCHRNMPRDATGEWLFDPVTAEPCVGYEAVRGLEAMRAVARTLTNELTDQEADILLASGLFDNLGVERGRGGD